MIATALGAAAMTLCGLFLVVGAPDGLWSRLLGLQWTAMGAYLLALVGLRRGDVLRPLMAVRLGVAAITALMGLYTLAVVEAAWAGVAWWRLSGGGGPSRLAAPSRLHNGVLGLFPLVEGAACLLVGGQAGLLLYRQPAVEPWAALFAVQSLFLAVYWQVCVRRACWEGLAVTIAGRLLVAGVFAVMWWHGDADRIGLLAAALVVSVVWSAVEVRTSTPGI